MIPTQSCCYQVSLVSESYSAHAVMASKGTHLPNSRARHGSRPCASTSQVPRRAVITSAVDGAVRRFCILLPITGTDFLSFCCLSTPSCPGPCCPHLLTHPASSAEGEQAELSRVRSPAILQLLLLLLLLLQLLLLLTLLLFSSQLPRLAPNTAPLFVRVLTFLGPSAALPSPATKTLPS